MALYGLRPLCCGGPGRPLRYRKKREISALLKLSAYRGERTSVGFHHLWIELTVYVRPFRSPILVYCMLKRGHLFLAQCDFMTAVVEEEERSLVVKGCSKGTA